MRWTVLTAAFLVASVPSVSAAAPRLVAEVAEGEGRFDIAAEALAVQGTPRDNPVTVVAAQATLYLIDDRRDHEVPNPANPGELLVSRWERTTRTVPLGPTTLTLTGNGSPGANFILLPHGQEALAVEGSLDGAFQLTKEPGRVLDRSHFVSDSAVLAGDVGYEISAGPSLRLEAPTAFEARAQGTLQVYVWGMDVRVDGPRSVSFRTGTWHESTAASGLHGTTHHVHAFLNLTGAAVVAPGSTAVHAHALDLASHGSIRYEGAVGTIDSPDGMLAVHGSGLTVESGRYVVRESAAGLLVETAESPTRVTGATAPTMPASASTAWMWVAAGLAGAAAIAYALPSLRGRRLRSRGRIGATVSGRALRAEAYAEWASRADVGGLRRLAAILAGRAARNNPKDPDTRLEHAILLQQAGHVRRAVREHEAASRLFAFVPDPAQAGLNAYHAAVACARLGATEDAIDWLQRAVECDPTWGSAAHREPYLARLRSHPDFHAVAGRVHA